MKFFKKVKNKTGAQTNMSDSGAETMIDAKELEKNTQEKFEIETRLTASRDNRAALLTEKQQHEKRLGEAREALKQATKEAALSGDGETDTAAAKDRKAFARTVGESTARLAALDVELDGLREAEAELEQRGRLNLIGRLLLELQEKSDAAKGCKQAVVGAFAGTLRALAAAQDKINAQLAVQNQLESLCRAAGINPHETIPMEHRRHSAAALPFRALIDELCGMARFRFPVLKDALVISGVASSVHRFLQPQGAPQANEPELAGALAATGARDFADDQPLDADLNGADGAE